MMPNKRKRISIKMIRQAIGIVSEDTKNYGNRFRVWKIGKAIIEVIKELRKIRIS